MPSFERRAFLRRLGAISAGLVAGCNAMPDRTTEPTAPATTVPATSQSPERSDTPSESPTTGDDRTGSGTQPSALSGAPGPLPAATWPLTYRGVTNASYAPDGPEFEGKPTVDWVLNEPVEEESGNFDPQLTPPVVADGRLFTTKNLSYGPEQVPPDHHYLISYDATSGTTLWKQPIRVGSRPTFPTAPAVHGSTVFVGQDQILSAHDIEDGEEAWQRDLDDSIDAVYPSPDRTYIRGDRSAAAIDDEGQVLWTIGLGHSPVALALGTRHLYVGVSRRILAVNPVTGKVRWERTLPATSDSGIVRLVTVDGGVFALQNSGDLYTFDASGKPVWNPDGSYGAISTDGGRLYATVTEAGALRSFDIATGKQLWELGCSDVEGCDAARHVGKPVVTGSEVYVPLDGGHLVAVRPDDGSILWRVGMEERVPVVTLGEDALFSLGDYEESIVKRVEQGTTGQ